MSLDPLCRRSQKSLHSFLLLLLVAALMQGCVLIDSNEDPYIEDPPPCGSSGVARYSLRCVPPFEDRCSNSSDCSGDQVCSTEFGDCSSSGGYDACGGTCIDVPQCEGGQSNLVCYTDRDGIFRCECTLIEPPECAATTCPVGSSCEVRCYEACPPCAPDSEDCDCQATCETVCIPNIDPQDPGECIEAACEEIGPACPEGTVAGVSTQTGCFTGYCIPLYACGNQNCSLITDAEECAAQFQCEPVFEGSECVCDENGQCTCENVWFDRCLTRDMPPPPPQGGDCFVGGCSGQLCADESLASTCEWNPEYACYDDATCERQADGECGWTATPALSQCLNQF